MNRPTLALLCVGLMALCAASSAEDWPTYRHDDARSGVTADELKPPLVESWVLQPRHAPQPAWGDPKTGPVEGILELRRVHFDDVFHVAVSDGSVYFGSSADNKVYALDAASGKVRWATFTGGPVRLAPTVSQGKVYVGSDDGFAWCLNASDGSVAWKFRAAPSDRKLLGHGKMISLWPLRTGVLVDGGVAYFGAGIFPAEGVYLHAVNAADGKPVWCNDTCGGAPQSRISPQGYLLASETTLFAPMGRVSPASFDRKDGRLLATTYFGKNIGGTYAMLVDDKVITGTEELVGYDQKTRARFASFKGRQLIVTSDAIHLVTDREMVALDRAAYPAASRRHQGILSRRQRLHHPYSNTRRTLGRLNTAIKADQQTLKAIGQRIAQAGVAAAERAQLEAERRDLETKIAADTKQAASLKLKVDEYKTQMDALADDGKIAEAELEKTVKWRIKAECPDALILAGTTLVAGGKGKVVAVATATGKVLWTAKVNGTAKGLAVASGRLFASTDTGAIYCFGPAGSPQAGAVTQPTAPSPYPQDALTPVYAAAADHIVKATGIKRGYCLVLGCGTGRLAYELAKRTELHVCGVEPDATKVVAARKALDAAGLYGPRVVVEQGDLSSVPYSDYFANLIVSDTALVSGQLPGRGADALRMLRPLGGTICIGQPAQAKGLVKPLDAGASRRWLEGAEVSTDGGLWLTFSRGALPGAGSWTHEYADPGNTACSDDTHAKCPLGLLWFGEPGPGKIVNRHSRAASPLSINGRMFVQGENWLMGYDAYNGLELWQRQVPGAIRVTVSHEASNLAANADSLFAAVGDHCLRLDPATGKTTATYKVPPPADGKKRLWGYVAATGGLLYGTRASRARTADAIFAIDLKSGALRWLHEGSSIPQGAIAIGAGRLFLAEQKVSDAQRAEALRERTAEAARLKGTEQIQAQKELKAAEVRVVTALDAKTGEMLWQKPMDLTGCIKGAYWCSLGAIYSDEVLLLFGVYADGHYWRDFFAGKFGSRRVVAVSAKDAKPLWDQRIGYRVRPLVIRDTLHAEPWAYDLRTGRQKMRIDPITGQEQPWQFARPGHHCGTPAGSPNLMLFRSYCLGYYDLVGDYGTMHFGAQRTGCWINFIPANGLVLVPEASVGCMCPFPNMCTVVFGNRDESRAWAYYSTPGPLTPVKRLALNLSAPGDRKDKAGTLWLGYPRPGGSLVLRFGVQLAYFGGWRTFTHDPERVQVEGTDKPWLFRSGVLGLRQCVLPLVESGDGAARYTVRLAFADLEQGAAGTRVFDIKLQDKVVAEGFDIAAAAGGRNKATIKEFKGIEVKDKLKIEFVAKAKKPTPEQLPIIQGIEVEREEVLSLGFTVPSFLLSDAKPEQSGEARIANYKDEAFEGTLRIEAPDGFTVTPAETKIALASAKKTAVALKAAVAKKGPRGKYPVAIKLLRPDGKVEWEQKAEIEYLANRSRIVVKASEDAYVGQSWPNVNRGEDTTMAVDGGHAKMGDESHHIAYLRFKLDVPGKPVAAMLRLYNAGNPSGSAGEVCLVTAPWSETKITYDNRPKPGQPLGKIGRVTEHQIIELPLQLSLEGRQELSLVIEPTSCDGVDYIAREGGKPAELVVEYEQ